MKLEIIQNYLSTQIASPPNFIFLQDNSQILSELSELMIHEILFRVVCYENDLQLRSELEWAKDDPANGFFCIISQKSEAENRLILDYFYRSVCFHITPQAILNFSGNFHWSEAANWLKGDDFWRVIDALSRTKAHPELQLVNSEEIYLASALLDHDLTRPFDMVSGTLFHFKTMSGMKYRNFHQNYPQLAASIEKKIFNDVPELTQFKEQPDLIQQIWSKKAEISQKIKLYQSVDDLKHQLAIKAPLFVRDQIDALEKNYFTTSEEVETYLQKHLVNDNLDGWIAYLKSENFLTEPLKAIIKRTINYIVRNPDNFDLNKMQQMVQYLSTHHLIHIYLKKSSEILHPFAQVFELFRNVVALYSIRNKIITFLALQSTDFQVLIQELYPQEISRIPLLLEAVQSFAQGETILNETTFKKLHQQIVQFQLQIHEHFINWIAANYVFAKDWFERIQPMQTLPHYFINTHLKETTVPVYFILLDGMRWDGWELLQPIIERIFRKRKIRVYPLLLPLPSITTFGRPFILTGDIKPTADWSAIRQAWQPVQTDIFTEFSSAQSGRVVETILHSTARLKIINIDLFDQRIHHSTLSLHLNYEEIQHEFLDVYVPILEQLPADSLILISSDHGFIQVSGKWFESTARILNPAQPFQHRRYLELPEVLADKKHFIHFSAERLGSDADSGAGLAFLKKPVVFKIQPTEKFVRYAHGGISLEEQVVPFVVIN